VDAVLYVVDLARMTAFYRDGIGLTASSSTDGATELECAGATLHLVQVAPSVAAEIVIAEPPVRREETPIKLIVPADDLPAARRRIAEHGGAVDGPDREWTWKGTVRVDAVDPEGNVLQLAVR
jgi:predicted enzyme related to lactoylglutathione lyase